MSNSCRCWTNLSKNCYNNGCMCSKCNEYPVCSQYGYEMKRSVLKLVSVLGRTKVEKGDYFGYNKGDELLNLS